MCKRTLVDRFLHIYILRVQRTQFLFFVLRNTFSFYNMAGNFFKISFNESLIFHGIMDIKDLQKVEIR